MLLILSQAYIIITDCGVSAPGYGREVVDILNFTYKMPILQLKETMKINGSKGCDTQIAMHSATHKADVILSQEFKKHLSNASRKNGVIDQVKYKNGQVNGSR